MGKRSINYYTGNEDDDFDYIDTNDEKRSSRLTDGQKFAFGLGKRENTLDDLLETSEGDNLPERQIRAPHYKFGLGKRSLELPLRTLSSSQVGNKETTQDGKTIQ